MDTKNIKISDLEEKLAALTGHNFTAAERMERAIGNITPDLTFSRGFQARLASIALGCPVQDIQDLPIKKYVEITATVFRFFYNGSESAEDASEKSESVP